MLVGDKMKTFNYSKLKNYVWDNEILSLVSQIHEYKGKQEYYMVQKPEALNKLVEIAIVQSTEDQMRLRALEQPAQD